MSISSDFKALTRTQRATFTACFLGWTLDAFDFFLLTLCLKAVAADFHVAIPKVAEALFWTLAMRPVGAFLFGAMAERFGRRPTLMVNIISFSVFELASAFAPSLGLFLVSRALFGIAMGGEWGVGAALAFETLPAKGRGVFSGLLQEGYVCGNLLAAALYAVLFPHLHGTGIFTPWRVLFMIGALPAVLAFYLRFQVEESPTWLAARAAKAAAPKTGTNWSLLASYLPSFLFLVLLMTAFASFSHGTQDLYPTFLERESALPPVYVGMIVVIANLGALFGGICCGALSERFGRKRTIIVAALLALPMIPLWTYSHTVLWLAVGGFLMQFMVQGAWGIIPAHLNELSPGPVRAIFPGFAYQLGNLLASRNGVFQTVLAQRFAGGLRTVMAATVLVVAIVVAAITSFGKEAKGAQLNSSDEPA
ncbi:MFS transporter [Granulicella sp. WH15]|uniref:MFS transporter n=1 Tax=Granulicella sp. WH15 TaxID=2602070 RepID=UPI001366FAB4|nr:MFS transporter [Granulicella sp. WH15]QHN03292.1 MFS transporter [Granulicella sp. WH15]